MRSHFHISATYLKHFSRDPSKGRKSIVHVFNKKKQIEQYLPVDQIGIKTGAFSDSIENFNQMIEARYNEFMDLRSIRYPTNITVDRLKNGMMMLFNFIFRTKIMYDYIRKSYRNYPDLIRIYGADPWHSENVVPMIFFELLLKRTYPISIRGYKDDVFITGDNPIVIFRHPYGFCTVYLLPLDRRHIFCLGYYIKEEQLKFVDIYLNKAEIITGNVNEWIKIQAETHYII